MRLIDLQRDFQSAILAAPNAERAQARFRAALRPCAGASLERRLAVHLHLQQTIASSLQNGFALTHKYLGDSAWRELVGRYLQVYPPTDSALGRLPEHIAEFVRTTAPYADDSYLGELVSWEFQRRRALAAAVELPLDERHLGAGSISDAPDVPIAGKRRSYLVELHYSMHLDPVELGLVPPRRDSFFVYGNVVRGRAHAREVSGVELRVLVQLRAGTTLHALARTLDEYCRDSEEAKALLGRLMRERSIVLAGAR